MTPNAMPSAPSTICAQKSDGKQHDRIRRSCNRPVKVATARNMQPRPSARATDARPDVNEQCRRFGSQSGRKRLIGRASSRIIAAPFSAIMMVGELVLPEVIVGITEASTTRMRSRPNTRSRSSTTAIGSLSRPIFAVPTGWKIVVPIVARGLDQRRPRRRPHAVARQIFDRLERRAAPAARTILPRDADRIGGDAPVLVGRKIVRLDRRRVGRIGAT